MQIEVAVLELTPKGDANMYINDFIRFKNQLEDINEGEDPATLMDQFLDQIKDNKYEVTVTNLRMDNGKTLETCIEAIQCHDLFLSHHRVQEHRFIKIRCLNQEDDVSGPSKTSTYIEPEVWQGLSTEQCRIIMPRKEI